MSRTAAPPAKDTGAPPRRVSHRHDATERQADRAADIVARGGSVTGWSFANVAAAASVHRDEDKPKKLEDKPRTQDEAYKEAAGKAIETGVEQELPSGKKVRQVIEETPPLAAAAVGGLALAGKDVPVSGFPGVKDVVPAGVSIGVRAEGLPGLLSGEPRPGGGPTRFSDVGLGLTLGYTEQLPKGGKKPQSAAEKKSAAIAADTARLRNDPIMKAIAAKQDKELSDAAIASVVARQKFAPAGQVPGLPFPLVPPVLPTRPLDEPSTPVQQRKPEDAVKAEEQKKREDVQREPASTSEAAPAQEYDTGGVDAAIRGGGRALEPGLRHSMEARFGYDFSSVRLHDDPQAASAAAAVDATAFTVGEHIVFGSGRFDPSSPAGRHLLAHELAHVVQQRGGATPRTTSAPTRIHRLDAGNWFALLFGGEGTWTDRELEAYLQKVTAAGSHEGWWESDNKARAIVRKFMAGTPGWDLLARQKAILIDEMLDGAVLDEDEEGILNLLETAGRADLAAIFLDPKKRFTALDDAIDGAEHTRLLDFVTKRFAKGAAGLKAGDREVTGDPLPAAAPSFGFDPSALDARVDAGYTDSELAAMIDRFSPADRAKARDYVVRVTRPRRMGEMEALVRERQRTPDTDQERRNALTAKIWEHKTRIRVLDVVVAATVLSELPAIDETVPATAPLAGDDAKAARDALLPPPLPKPKPKTEPSSTTDTSSSSSSHSPPKGDQRKSDAARKKEAAAERAREAAERKAMFAPGGKYRTLLKKALTETIDIDFAKANAKGKTVASSEIERMARPAKDATDAVFGAFYSPDKRPELTFGKNGRAQTLFSYFEKQTTAVASAQPRDRVEWALEQIRYYYRSYPKFRRINEDCDALPQSTGGKLNDAAQAQEDVARDLVADGVSATWKDSPKTTADKLIFIDRNWGGAEEEGKIYVDLKETGDVAKDRAERWNMFQTLVHEYIHSLADPDYNAYAAKRKKTSEREWNTLIEGVTSLLTDIVWAKSGSRLTADRPTRELVEGTAWAALPPIAVTPPGSYDSITEAQRLVDLVGAPNLWTAYFLGEVDRIGGPAKGKAR